MDEKKKNGNGNDDAYEILDTGASVEDIEHEMERTAREAAEEVSFAPVETAPAADGTPRAEDGNLREENDELRDRHMRALADFENFRKRADREKQNHFRYALADAFRDLLPVLDNFDRALEHAEKGDEFHRGVALIYKQMFDMLQRYGLRQIDEARIRFDPNIHEAVVRDEDPNIPANTVVQILQKGYFLHDRLLRPALVKVAVGGPEESPAS